MKRKFKKEKKFNWNLFYIFISFLSLALFIKYNHRYSLSLVTGISFMGTLVAPIAFHTKYFEIKGERWWQKFLNIIVILIFILPAVFLQIKLSELYYSYQLQHNSVLVHGIVMDFEQTSGKSGIHYYATIAYNYENNFVFQKVGNDNSYYKLGDDLTMRISTYDPEIFEITETKRLINK